MLGDVKLEIKVIVKITNMHMLSLKYQFRPRAVYPPVHGVGSRMTG